MMCFLFLSCQDWWAILPLLLSRWLSLLLCCCPFIPLGYLLTFLSLIWKFRSSRCRSFFSVYKKEFINVAAEGMSSISKTRHRVLGQNRWITLSTRKITVQCLSIRVSLKRSRKLLWDPCPPCRCLPRGLRTVSVWPYLFKIALSTGRYSGDKY